ncbi:glycosyltransferase family 4 protein [Flavihumibacter sp. R14]|nr:glycosyltransferase family 4 protein [Flavihumibacter soli]
MKCVISHPNIAPYIKESVLAYQENGALVKFYTTYFQHPQYPFTQRLIRFFPWLEQEFKRRSIEEINYSYLKGNPFHEMLRIISARLNISWVENRVWQWNDRKFDNWVAGNLKPGIEWVHTYEHAALSTIRKAKALNMISFYEQPSQHHLYLSRILEDQLNKYPELNSPATKLMYDRNAIQCDARKDLELAECDYIICNSSFTQKTLKLAGIREDKIIMIPYGFPETSFELPKRQPSKKFTFLYAGNQNLRKGIHILYKAWKACNFDPAKAELILVGESQLPDSLRNDLPASVKFIPNIPHAELMSYYQKANVFVLPTLADGFGMVVSEAMSQGLPVITTDTSGGPDIINNRVNGLIVESDNIPALRDELRWCFENPDKLIEIGNNAFLTAQAYPWSSYRKRLIAEVLSRVELHQRSNRNSRNN